MATNRHQTQWTGQFGAACELTRRGYLVTLTMGNAPAADLLCKSPNGTCFSLQIKSNSSKNYFLYQKSFLTSDTALHFVFVLVPAALDRAPEYFVLDNAQFQAIVAEEAEIQREKEVQRGRPFKAFSPGINDSTLNRAEFRHAWHNLPR